MKLTVIGNSGPYPKANGACSGYLIEDGDTKVLLDCGNGVLSILQDICDVRKLDAIILSHLHSDHISDILVLKYALGINKKEGYLPISLYTPQDDMDMVERFNYNDAFNIIPIDDNKSIKIDNLNISFQKMIHPVDTYAIKIDNDISTFVYSGDTSYNEELIEFAKLADMFLCESSILERDMKEDIPHLSPKEAGEIGKKASVKRLILTHFWPEYNLQDIIDEARYNFDGILEISEVRKTYGI
ncbi:MBL fold metallo-hydrolase [Dethiothermospora halolimnae]|uniref:MBL fold metallo-hydrolase n=1 Tax=Dethiothermospora halolimnae TaxID=3114390 RepID=UPI003CCBD3A2